MARDWSRMTARLLSFPLVAVIVAAGVWVAGGLITNDFRTSAALITGWMLVAAIACVAIAVRWRGVRVPVIAGFLVSAGAIGGFLALTTLRDRVVHEQVFVGRPAADVATGAPAPRGPVELARGRLRSGEHRTVGVAAVVRLPNGARYLTLRGFSTAPGPDLRVRLVPGGGSDGAARGNVDLGGLKGNRGDQQYRLPSRAVVAGRSVVIWCRAFSAPFGSARLAAT
jgi:Electron transfer DM13